MFEDKGKSIEMVAMGMSYDNIINAPELFMPEKRGNYSFTGIISGRAFAAAINQNSFSMGHLHQG